MKKRRKLKIFLIILAVIVVTASGVLAWQWDNVRSVIYFMRYSEDDLDKMLDDNKKELDSALEGIGAQMPRELTEEELQALQEGTITQTDAVEISLGKTTLQEKIEQKKPKSQVSSGSGGSTVLVTDSPVSNLVAQLYVLKSSYMGKLGGLEAQAKAEYSATPAAERTAGWKSSMISKYSGKVSALEGECDAKVEAVISQIKAELAKTGGDTSIIGKIRSAYENEKQIKKAYYLNTYLK